MTHVDLRKAVRRAVSITRPQWDENPRGSKRGINVRTYLRSVSPVVAHPGDLQAVLVSIILNAVDAMPRGGEIYLTTEEVPGFTHIYIQDNGKGISEEIMDRIFDPFFTTREGARSGLGLSLAYGIVKRHGGEIEITSQEGEGSTVDIKLPIAREIPTSGAAGKKNRIRDSQIMIIADEGMVKDLLSHLFKSKGGKVKTASTRPEALKILKKNRFDLVAVDLHTLPARSTTLVEKIKEIEKDMPVVIIKAREEKKSPKAFEKRQTGRCAVNHYPEQNYSDLGAESLLPISGVISGSGHRYYYFRAAHCPICLPTWYSSLSVGHHDYHQH